MVKVPFLGDDNEDEAEKPSGGRTYEGGGAPKAGAPVETRAQGGGPIGGMPEDFLAPERARPAGPVTADAAERLGPTFRPTPIYWTDDEWAPANWPDERIARLQADLAAVGLIGPKETVTYGVWDPKSAAAYKDLLAYSNSVGLPAEQAIELYRMGQQVEEFQPEPFIRPDPAKLAQDVKDYMKQKVGRKLDPDELVDLAGELGGFYQQAHEQSVATDRQAFDAEQGIGAAPEVVQDVDPAARFAELIERRYAPEIQRVERVDAAATNRDNLLDNILALDNFMGA